MQRSKVAREGTRVDAIARDLSAAYLDTRHHSVQFLTEHFADCGRAFGGDRDMVLVTAVLGQRRLEVARDYPDDTRTDPARMAMSALRIADASGIPRETVRHRLAALEDRGCLMRDPRHGWYIAGSTGMSPAREALGDLEARSFRRLARLHLRLTEILDRTPEDDDLQGV